MSTPTHAPCMRTLAQSLSEADSRLYALTQELALLADLVGAMAQSAISQVSVEALAVSLAELAGRVTDARQLVLAAQTAAGPQGEGL